MQSRFGCCNSKYTVETSIVTPFYIYCSRTMTYIPRIVKTIPLTYLVTVKTCFVSNLSMQNIGECIPINLLHVSNQLIIFLTRKNLYEPNRARKEMSWTILKKSIETNILINCFGILTVSSNFLQLNNFCHVSYILYVLYDEQAFECNI